MPVFDATTLLLFLEPEANAPTDPATNEPVTDAKARIDQLIETLDKGRETIVIPTPALPALLGVSANTVQGRLRADSPLVRSGLVCIDTDGDLKALDRLNRLAVREHGRGDVGVVDLVARNGYLMAEGGQHRHDVRAVLEDRERGNHLRRVLQRVDHAERYRPGLRARDRDEVFADNLAADVQGFFAVAGPVEAPASGDMGRGSHESGRDENVGIDEHPGQRSPPDAFSGPPVRLPKSS